MNTCWGPPDDAENDEHGLDAWFDVWIGEDGSLRTYLGSTSNAPATDLIRESMQRCLQELIAGETLRIGNSRNPSGEVDLDQGVLMVRVGHQRNGEVSCGWGRFAAEPESLIPLRELAVIASGLLSAQQDESDRD